MSLCLSVCLFVCLSTRISHKPHVQTVWHFLYMLPVAVAQSSSDDNAHYVLLIFVLLNNGANGPESKTTLCFVETTRWRHRCEVALHPLLQAGLSHIEMWPMLSCWWYVAAQCSVVDVLPSWASPSTNLNQVVSERPRGPLFRLSG